MRLGAAAAAELNKFVVWLCLPALLFRATATAHWQQIWHPRFVLSYTLATLAVYVLTLALRCRRPRGFADAAIDGLSAAYANTDYVGIPLCVLVLGPHGLLPALIATLIVVCVLFAIAVVCVEIGLQGGQAPAVTIARVLAGLLRNPLVMAPLLGAAWAASGWAVPQPLDKFLRLLGSATTPCALVSLGAFLAARPVWRLVPGASTLAAFKLVLHPLLTWLLATRVFGLPPPWAEAALLLSALPTGTGPYMLAGLYEREAAVVSATILCSTVGSLLTLTGCLALALAH